MGTSLCFTFFSLALFIITFTQLLPKANSATHWGDTQALKQFKNGLDPNSLSPGSCLASWDFNFDPCDSLFGEKFTCGFRCDAVISGSSRVTELALDSAGYSGSLASSSWNLPYLQTLDLSNNYFSGSIPDSLSNLTRLSRLILSFNSLSGSVPESIGSLSGLQELYLDNNKLEGAMPWSVNGLKNLIRLGVQGNKLSGELPDLGQLGSLNLLDASDNAISGVLPATLPASLVEFIMRNNQLEGNIPASVTSMVNLQVMDLSHNKLSGSVPSGLFTHPSLEQLTLSYNQFGSVQVPYSWAQQSPPLIAVDLSNNQLQGLLPAFMGLMPKLSSLSLENNWFTGMIPTQYAIRAVLPGAGVSQFQRLLLGGNYLFGPIPGPLMKITDPGSVTVQLGRNCLYRCPMSFFFCEGGEQKSLVECRRMFGPVIP